jgi:hypothetical protein
LRSCTVPPPFGETVAGQLHELDLGGCTRPVERAGKVGDRHRGTLEQADRDEIGRDRAHDLRGERFDPRGDLHCSGQNAHPYIVGVRVIRFPLIFL